MPLIKGTVLTFTDGTTGTVGEKIGEGGQGEVYHIEHQGKPRVLKWYKVTPRDAFIENLKKNVARNSPSDSYIWPLAVTCSGLGVGYIMELVDRRKYKDFSKFLINKCHFASEEAAINAAINLCVAFQRLHLKGLAYFDLNDGNFFFNPQNGDLLIGDNDNVSSADNNVSNIQGKRGYMAPEIVLGKNPNRYSDFYSLSLILFRIIFIDHPLHGKNLEKHPCLTDKVIKYLYGTNPIFIFDSTNPENRATREFSPNAIARWNEVPNFVRKAFIAAFSKECQTNPQRRPLESNWLKVFLRWRSYLNVCPSCGNEVYIEPKNMGICQICHKHHRIYWMQSDHKEYVPLVPGQIIYESQIGMDNHFNTLAKVVQSNDGRGILGIKNLSSIDWIVRYGGKTQVVPPGKAFILADNIKIQFSNIRESQIKLI